MLRRRATLLVLLSKESLSPSKAFPKMASDQQKVALVVTSNIELNRPESLNIEDINSHATSYLSPSVVSRERRGSKSCLKVSADDHSSGGISSPRRRSVHFDASPASEVEVPNGDMDNAVRGCGTLVGPATSKAGKEIFVKTEDEGDEEMMESGLDDQDEETQRLALAKAIARRQSASSTTSNRCRSPPPPTLMVDQDTS